MSIKVSADSSAVQPGNLGLGWWNSQAWNEDTLNLVASLTKKDAEPRLLHSYLRALLSETAAPPEEFVLRVLWRILKQEDITFAETRTDEFWLELFFHLDSLRGTDLNKVREASVSLLLRTTEHPLPDACLNSKTFLDYVTNPNLSADYLHSAWMSPHENVLLSKTERAQLIVKNPNASPETLTSIFESVMADLTQAPSKVSPGLQAAAASSSSRQLLSEILSNPSFPRGVYEAYSGLFELPQPNDHSWTKDGTSPGSYQRVWLLLPWYSTVADVRRRWDAVFGEWSPMTADTASYELEGSEVQNLRKITAVADLFARPSNSRWVDKKLTELKTQSEVEKIISLLKQSGPWTFFNIENGEYDEATWVDLFNGMSKDWSDPAVKFTQNSLITAALKGETTPDWFRFLVGVDIPHLRRLPHNWLYFHGGATQYAASLGFDNVPEEWLIEVIQPAGIDVLGDNDWRR